MMHKKDFGNNLKRLREQANINQNELAERLKVLIGSAYSRSNISKWESGDSIPPLTIIPALSKVLEVPLISFFVLGGQEGDQSEYDDAEFTTKISQIQENAVGDSNAAINSLLAVVDELYINVKGKNEEISKLKDKLKSITGIINNP